MPETVKPDQFLALSGLYPVIDVRSPGEFVHGHIPGAVNIPLFNNEERAMIGTLYVQKGKTDAIREGMGIAGAKFREFIQKLENYPKEQQLLLHCWRGGMRSESMAWFYEKLGFRVLLLEGGYKSYRNYIRKAFTAPRTLYVIGGMTGSGKTALLRQLASLGQQVIDLEDMANHKGSAFGHLGQPEQPTTEQFENNLYQVWSRLDANLPVWIEHESIKIGSVYLPDTFYRAMLQGVLVNLQVKREIRVERLVEEYSGHDKMQINAALRHIQAELGTSEFKLAMEALEQDDFSTVAELALKFYDKAYTFALAKRPLQSRRDIALESGDIELNARLLVELMNNERINSD